MAVVGLQGLAALVGLAACGGDDSNASATAAPTTALRTTVLPTTVLPTTVLPTTVLPTTVPTTTTTAPDPALAPPCNVGEVKVNRESKVYFEPGDPRYGTVPLPLVICLPSSSVAQSEGFKPAPPA
jgi:hypothetical protein